MKRVAIYPLSADPITYGHINIVERVLEIFDEVIVGIGVNPDKKYLFSLMEREALAIQALSKFGDRVTVTSFSGLLSDFAAENRIRTIIRGARNSADFDFERLLNDINQSFQQGLETLIFIADNKLSHISSSAVKELTKNQAKNLRDYVPIVVKQALEMRIAHQTLIGVTGEIACGKSYIISQLLEYNKKLSETCPSQNSVENMHNIDLDAIGHEILESASEPVYEDTRMLVEKRLGPGLINRDGSIEISILRDVIFKDPAQMQIFNEIMIEPMMLMLRRKLFGKSGIIFINSALLMESPRLTEVVNNNVLFVKSPVDLQRARMYKRGYSAEEVENRMKAQWPLSLKIDQLVKNISKDEHGCYAIVENDSEETHKLNCKIIRLWEYVMNVHHTGGVCTYSNGYTI